MTAPGLYGGFSGVAWVLEHLTGRLLEPPAPGEEDPGEEVATALTNYLGRTPWLDDYDLISGLVGFGVWAVERAPRAWGDEAAASVVRRLGELAERRDGGVTWRTPRERMLASEAASHPQGNFNLGVAHGVPGVIGILGEMVAAGLPAGGAAGEGTAREARELLAGAVEWLLGQRLPGGSPSCFPYAVAPGVEPVPARFAWCYGDIRGSRWCCSARPVPSASRSGSARPSPLPARSPRAPGTRAASSTAASVTAPAASPTSTTGSSRRRRWSGSSASWPTAGRARASPAGRRGPRSARSPAPIPSSAGSTTAAS